MKTKTFFFSIISAMLLSVSMSASADSSNPFTMLSAHNNFTLIAQSDTPDSKCGAAKCGGEKRSSDSKCGAAKCGAESKPADAKCGAAKCGADKKPADTKCGAAKCGAGK
ncbi:Low-complexity protein [uncultured Thiomicrorhabdus sp.]